jgi:hypothetical protein
MKMSFPGVGTSGRGSGYKERMNECDYGGYILYSYVKIEE